MQQQTIPQPHNLGRVHLPHINQNVLLALWLVALAVLAVLSALDPRMFELFRHAVRSTSWV